MATVEDVLNSARTYLDDDIGANWSDVSLMPKLREAYRELENELLLANIPVIKVDNAIFTVLAGAVSLGVNQPVDLVEPIQMKERAPGGTLGDFQDMTEVDFIPTVNQSTELVYWAWLNQVIVFLGATANRQVMLRYKKRLFSPPTLLTDPINFILGELFLGSRVAALAAESVGNYPGKESLHAQAMSNLDKIIRVNILQMQNLPARRKGYHRGTRLKIGSL